MVFSPVFFPSCTTNKPSAKSLFKKVLTISKPSVSETPSIELFSFIWKDPTYACGSVLSYILNVLLPCEDAMR